jgi:hypothetical protein
MTNAKLKTYLKSVNACSESIVWLGDRDLKTAWAECERADWMLWLAAKRCDRKKVVLAACACARTALKYVPKGEMRPLRAIETAEAWTRGEATIEEVRTAAYAARAAAVTAYAEFVAAYAAAYAAYASAASAASAAYASAAANAAYARSSSLRKMADIVRGIIKVEDLEQA